MVGAERLRQGRVTLNDATALSYAFIRAVSSQMSESSLCGGSGDRKFYHHVQPAPGVAPRPGQAAAAVPGCRLRGGRTGHGAKTRPAGMAANGPGAARGEQPPPPGPAQPRGPAGPTRLRRPRASSW